jgi:excisionase family DNA binding protein
LDRYVAVIISPDDAGTDRLLTGPDAARLLKVSESMVAKLRRSGDLETVHVGRAARVRLSDVERIIREGL